MMMMNEDAGFSASKQFIRAWLRSLLSLSSFYAGCEQIRRAAITIPLKFKKTTINMKKIDD